MAKQICRMVVDLHCKVHYWLAFLDGRLPNEVAGYWQVMIRQDCMTCSELNRLHSPVGAIFERAQIDAVAAVSEAALRV